MNIFKSFFSMSLVAATLAACVPSGPITLSENGNVREEVITELVAMKKAEMLATNCRRKFLITLGYNADREDKMLIALKKKAKAQGYTRWDIAQWTRDVDHAALQKDFINYIETRKLVFGEPVTFCDAGEKEIAMKSKVGSYLYIRDIYGRTREELGVTIPKPEGK